ncbi:organomercurial lyase [Qipengyuania gaetbuli]|uniref:organomercurial lyase n=1 Tax=Qipengyuania gaetbuli TaxID=266952 RepID=UPI001CD20915|nr:organomercurial lyase [Qipengyuania gaetbuli]MCA0911272.1 alkylmercury lyase family protein [Qipengyuania gaetbuli]
MRTEPLTPFELQVRGELTRAIAELGYAPTNEALGERIGAPVATVERALKRLNDAHALQLHPHCCKPWAVHPFALSPASCWVEAGARGWWANCLYCGMGIAAAIGEDAAIHTRLGGEGEPVVVHIENQNVQERELLFHLSTPVREWWDNVIHACATFQPFRSEAEIDLWCQRHALPRGAVVPMERMWLFASEWYGDYLREPWKKRSVEDASAVFAKHGFEGDFWRLE